MSSNVISDDTSPQIQYEPEAAWQLDTGFGTYGTFNGTLHGTTQTNAKASIQFTGTSISVTCFLWPTGSNFTATLDSSLVGTYNTAVASTSAATTKVMFTKDNLAGGTQHTLVLEKIANDAGWVSTIPGDTSSHLNIDSITIVGGTPATSTPSSPSSSSSLSTGAIAGIVVGIVAIILLVIATIWYRHRRGRKASQAIGHTPFTESQPPSNSKGLTSSDDSSSPVSTTATASGQQPRARTGRSEKVGLPFTNQNEGPGSNSRSRWRPSLFELPGNRVVRAQSRMPPPQTSPTENSGDTAGSITPVDPPAGNAIRFAPAPLLSVDGNAHTRAAGPRQQQRTTGSSRAPETVFSDISGPESHVTESTQPPSTIPSTPPPAPEPVMPSPSSSPNKDAVPEKALFQGQNSGTGSSLPMTASTIPPASVSPPSSSASGGANTNMLLHEVAILRDQVRQLTELHRGGSRPLADGEEGQSDYHEPPPEYVGRDRDTDSDEESRH